MIQFIVRSLSSSVRTVAIHSMCSPLALEANYTVLKVIKYYIILYLYKIILIYLYQSISIYLYLSISIYLYLSLSTSIYLYLSIYLSFIYPSIPLSIYIPCILPSIYVNIMTCHTLTLLSYLLVYSLTTSMLLLLAPFSILLLCNVDIGYLGYRVLAPDQNAGSSFQTCLESKKLKVRYIELFEYVQIYLHLFLLKFHCFLNSPASAFSSTIILSSKRFIL